MENSIDQTGAASTRNGSTPLLRIPISVWCALGAGVLGTTLFLHLAVVQPVTRELAQLQTRISGLEQGMNQVVGEKGSLAATNSLLGQIIEQSGEVAGATAALNELVLLNRSVMAQEQEIVAAQESLARMTNLVEAVKSQSDALHVRLAKSDELTHAARQATDAMLDLQSDLRCESSLTRDARAELNRLIALRTSLNARGEGVELATDRVHELLALKDSVIAQTDDLASAIETLELTDDLHEQFQQSAPMIRNMRLRLTEILMLSPTFEQAMQVLSPLTELGNLRRLDRADLRRLASAILEKRKTEVAEVFDRIPVEAAADSSSLEGLPVATLPGKE